MGLPPIKPPSSRRDNPDYNNHTLPPPQHAQITRSKGLLQSLGKIFDRTTRNAFEAYQRQRVNIAGDAMPYDPDALDRRRRVVKHNINRIRDSLPNGYAAGRPSRTAPTPTPVSPAPTFRPHPSSWTSTAVKPTPTAN